MAKQAFWNRKHLLPGQSAVEETAETFWMLKLLHPPSATAMVLGAVGLGYVGWRLFRDSNLWAALVAAAVGAFVGAWVGLLLYCHWWFLGSLIIVGAMMVFLMGVEPNPDPPPYYIGNYLSDRDLLLLRITVICLAALWCGLLVALAASLRRLWSAA